MLQEESPAQHTPAAGDERYQQREFLATHRDRATAPAHVARRDPDLQLAGAQAIPRRLAGATDAPGIPPVLLRSSVAQPLVQRVIQHEAVREHPVVVVQTQPRQAERDGE